MSAGLTRSSGCAKRDKIAFLRMRWSSRCQKYTIQRNSPPPIRAAPPTPRSCFWDGIPAWHFQDPHPLKYQRNKTGLGIQSVLRARRQSPVNTANAADARQALVRGGISQPCQLAIQCGEAGERGPACGHLLPTEADRSGTERTGHDVRASAVKSLRRADASLETP